MSFKRTSIKYDTSEGMICESVIRRRLGNGFKEYNRESTIIWNG